MKKIIYAILLSIFIFLSSTVTANAKPRLDVLKHGGFIELSDEDMQDTVDAMIQKIAKEQKLPYALEVSCFDWKENNCLAYNTLITKTICVNISHFRDDVDATAAGESVEFHLVKTLAHEVRHSYQYVHQFDDSDYGRACYANFQNYIEFNGYNLKEYNEQFIEADANVYGAEYANKFVKIK